MKHKPAVCLHDTMLPLPLLATLPADSESTKYTKMTTAKMGYTITPNSVQFNHTLFVPRGAAAP